MDQLGRKGWFTPPSDDDDFPDSPFGYIVKGKPTTVPSAPAEAVYRHERDKYLKAREESRKAGEVSALETRYWGDWLRIIRWEEAAAAATVDWEKLHKTKGMLRVYLAGPDVFLSNAASFGKTKQNLCTQYGFVGMFPLDNDLDVSGLSKHQAALMISAANENMIRRCDLLIANLTPFRSPSADPGTTYEMGFARSLGLPVFAYTNVTGTLLERTTEALGGRVAGRPSGEPEDPDHMEIENFGCVDNLMLVGAVESAARPIVIRSAAVDRRFTDLRGFEECLRLAARKLGVGGRSAHVR